GECWLAASRPTLRAGARFPSIRGWASDPTHPRRSGERHRLDLLEHLAARGDRELAHRAPGEPREQTNLADRELDQVLPRRLLAQGDDAGGKDVEDARPLRPREGEADVAGEQAQAVAVADGGGEARHGER